MATVADTVTELQWKIWPCSCNGCNYVTIGAEKESHLKKKKNHGVGEGPFSHVKSETEWSDEAQTGWF